MFIDVLFQILHLQYPFNRVVPVINFQYSFLEVIFAHMQNTRTHALSLVTEPNNALNVDRVSHGRLLEECYYIKCEATNQSSHLSTSTSQGRTCPVTRKFGIWGMVTSNANFTFCSYSELNSWLSQNTTCKFPRFSHSSQWEAMFFCPRGQYTEITNQFHREKYKRRAE